MDILKSYKNEINLPCSIGDTVYYIGTECTYPDCPDEWDWCFRHCDKVKKLKIKEMVVKQFRIKGDDKRNSITDTDSTCSSTEHSFYFSDIGIKVFLTKKEAEKELERQKANENCR